ncbi:MAG: glycosyltransferase, partial [Proteobacteria bacterium]|nr:glycosyltransferase [Pseudomonadota bacterium]
HFVNVVSPTFLQEIVSGQHQFVEPPIQQELTNKYNAGCAVGILNAPDPGFDPSEDNNLEKMYGPKDHVSGKRANKLFLQEKLQLMRDAKAPVFFWPSRLDPIQKGCQLLSQIFYHVISKYWNQNLQVVFVANGDFQMVFRDIVNYHGFQNRVAICDFDNELEHLAYGASDFILMPSKFEPCGLPQMIAPLYGALPVVHDTGGIHDTISDLDVHNNSGNGFPFKNFDANGLFWAIDQAMNFYNLPDNIKAKQIKRIMTQSAAQFTHAATARQYIELYEKMLKRPLIV